MSPGWAKHSGRYSRSCLTWPCRTSTPNSKWALGSGDLRIIARHVIPNTVYPLLILASLSLGGIVITFAALSFLGLGAPPGYADWGQLISLSHNWIAGIPGHALEFWYTLIVPGVAIFLFVLGWNLLGDAFRDIFDPRLQGSR